MMKDNFGRSLIEVDNIKKYYRGGAIKALDGYEEGKEIVIKIK